MATEPLKSQLLSKSTQIDHAFYYAGMAPPEGVASLKQTHSTHIFEATEAFKDPRPEGDGVWTKTPHTWVGVQTADCMPVLFASLTRPVVAAVHAGWRGLRDGILAKTVEILEQQGIRPRDLMVAIGPSIGPCCFEVDQNTIQQFIKKWEWLWAGGKKPIYKNRKDIVGPHALTEPLAPYAPAGKNNLWLDLKAIAKLQLLNTGIMDPNIDDLSICTYCGTLRLQGEELRAETNDLASYRRATHCGISAGRQWSVIRHKKEMDSSLAVKKSPLLS